MVADSKGAFPLCDAQIGDSVRITQLCIEGAMRLRLLDLGFIPGAIIKVLQKSPLGDPMAFRVSQTTIALRKEESSQILVEKLGDE
ncbi:FeoA family protein [Thermoflavimicrobium daqui]|uniref:Ferrous iron transport protein A n=1 Tax=Thermoflavimicrobium daqui TaxID=2137476 RepID=A0A364K9G2_9BACL|nr:FeoA family protein [Thermoflavimicrobium daqui]RAL26918.1 ferrous iron transport protein A [Thermoflavimicrobium daqui]